MQAVLDYLPVSMPETRHPASVSAQSVDLQAFPRDLDEAETMERVEEVKSSLEGEVDREPTQAERVAK